MRIFVSYRRSDVGGYAGRLSDTLLKRLGAKNVFQDVANIAVGQDFTAAIHRALADCDAALAVIGPGWLTAATPEGGPRLLDPDDYVRLELATVLQRGLPVAPVLVGGTTLPAAADLPEDLRPLVRHQAIELRDETWHQDVENLLRSLRGEPVASSADRGRRRVALALGALVLAVVVVIGLAVWRPWAAGPSTGGGAAAPELTGCPATTGAGWTPLTVGAQPTGRVQQSTGGEVAYTVQSASWQQLAPRSWQVVVDTALENLTPDDQTNSSNRYDSLIIAKRRFKQTCFDTTQDHVIPKTVGDDTTGYVVSCPPQGLIELLVNDDTRIPVTDATEPSQC